MSASRPSSSSDKAKRSRPGSNVSFGPSSDISIVRTVLAALLVLAGIAWLVVYVAVADEDKKLTAMGDLDRWNYLIGFGLLLLGLTLGAHKSTPLGRGRGVVVGMLGCFLIGLLWICTFYVISDNLSRLPIFDDLGQYNLFVGIAFMAVGFTYATRWE